MRVTVDLDTHGLLELMKVYYNLQYISDDIEVYRTVHGYHVIAHGLPITQQQAETLRIMLGDDARRIELDAMQIVKPKQILWTEKYPGRPRERIYIPSALY